jgi:hypothetical protein
MRFLAVDRTGKTIACQGQQAANPTHLGEGTITWASQLQCAVAASSSITLAVHVTASYEGFLDVAASVANHGRSSVTLKDLRLVVDLPKETATFMMGLGAVSGYRPAPEIAWPWSALGSISDYQNASVKKWGPMNPGDAVSQVWLGRVDRGLRIALKVRNYFVWVQTHILIETHCDRLPRQARDKRTKRLKSEVLVSYPKGTDPSWESPEDYPKSTAALGMTDWSNCPAGDPAAQGGIVNRTLCKGVLSVTEIDNGSDSDDFERESEVREKTPFCLTMFPA